MKYKLTKETIKYKGRKLYRIKAVSNFGVVVKGDLGGFVEREENLSQEGKAWIFDDAKVYGYAKVQDNACLEGDAEVYGCAVVSGNARIYDNAQVFEYAQISGNAWIEDEAQVYGGTQVYGDAIISCDVKIKQGNVFGFRKKREKITFIDLGNAYEAIAKGNVVLE
jgi:UDP-3-O-[3-hydroxymyristoyl] glucosamine N-acyltransferase